MGTGVGTEKGAEGGRRGDLSREPEGASEGQRRERSEPPRPERVDLFLSLSLSFLSPSLSACPQPDGKAVRIGTPLFLRYLALSLSPRSWDAGSGCVGGVAAAAAGAAGAAGEERGEERGARTGWGGVAGSGAAEELSPGWGFRSV